MNYQDLKNKSKITKSTFNSFVKKSKELFVLTKYSFDGMIDGIRINENQKLTNVSKENAIGHQGVWLVGGGRDYFNFFETETHFGIEVYNSCGNEILLTVK